MVSPLFYYQLVLVALVWLGLMLQWVWPSAPPCPQRHRSPYPHGPSASVRPHPLRGSPPSRTATPVCTAPSLAHSPPHARSRAWCPREGADARWIPRCTAAPTRTVPLAAGRAG